MVRLRMRPLRKEGVAVTTLADIDAAIDVLVDMCEQADQITGIEEAMDVLDRLGQLGAAVKRAQSMVGNQATSLIEQPVTVSGRRFVRENEYKRRFDHDRIAKMIADLAVVYPTTGEIRSTPRGGHRRPVGDAQGVPVGLVRRQGRGVAPLPRGRRRPRREPGPRRVDRGQGSRLSGQAH